MLIIFYISKKDKSSETTDKLSLKEKYTLLTVGAVILIGLFTFALSNGLRPNDLTLLLATVIRYENLALTREKDVLICCFYLFVVAQHIQESQV